MKTIAHSHRTTQPYRTELFWLGQTLSYLLCWFLTVSLHGQAPAAEVRPNILMIVTDDQGAWSMGCMGNPDAHTPSMDRLAAEGAMLRQAFVVTPVCSPSRVATITGRYASEFGIFDWINPTAEPQLGLDRSVATWPKLLVESGYRTGLIGKWHLGLQPHQHPTKLGYGSFAGFLEGGANTRNPTLSIAGLSRQREGLCVDLLTDLALDFIGQPDDRPWCLSLHYRAPHSAYLPVAEEVWAEFVQKEVAIPEYPDLDRELVTIKMREYLASIADIDRNLTRILTLLDEQNLADKTLVIFTSDHGYNLGHHGLEFKGNAVWRLSEPPPKEWPEISATRRPNMFDTSLRVPALVRFPGKIAARSIIESPTSNLDWFPTICQAAGIDIGELDDLSLRGRSMWSELLGRPTEPPDGELYFEYSMHHGSQTAMRAIRTDRWKFMRDYKNPGRVELYDLEQDPHELNNLAIAPNQKMVLLIDEFDQKLLEKMRSIGDHSCHN